MLANLNLSSRHFALILHNYIAAWIEMHFYLDLSFWKKNQNPFI